MELEKHLLGWIMHHDATHEGRVSLPDSTIVEKDKLIARDAELEFDPGEINFFTKWLYKWKQRNNIKYTQLHGEGEAANLTSVAIVR